MWDVLFLVLVPLAFFCSMRFGRTGTYGWLLTFWVLMLSWDCWWCWLSPDQWQLAGRTTVTIGAGLNALVTCVNGAMPVSDILWNTHGPSGPWWKRASECRYLLWLGDNWLGGLSLGDLLLYGGAAVTLLSLVVGKLYLTCRKEYV